MTTRQHDPLVLNVAHKRERMVQTNTVGSNNSIHFFPATTSAIGHLVLVNSVPPVVLAQIQSLHV